MKGLQVPDLKAGRQSVYCRHWGEVYLQLLECSCSRMLTWNILEYGSVKLISWILKSEIHKWWAKMCDCDAALFLDSLNLKYDCLGQNRTHSGVGFLFWLHKPAADLLSSCRLLWRILCLTLQRCKVWSWKAALPPTELNGHCEVHKGGCRRTQDSLVSMVHFGSSDKSVKHR